jgi:hypothetical protein
MSSCQPIHFSITNPVGKKDSNGQAKIPWIIQIILAIALNERFQFFSGRIWILQNYFFLTVWTIYCFTNSVNWKLNRAIAMLAKRFDVFHRF